MGETADVFAPFLVDHPECQYLTELILALESKTELERRIQTISNAIVGGEATVPQDIVGYM